MFLKLIILKNLILILSLALSYNTLLSKNTFSNFKKMFRFVKRIKAGVCYHEIVGEIRSKRSNGLKRLIWKKKWEKYKIIKRKTWWLRTVVSKNTNVSVIRSYCNSIGGGGGKDPNPNNNFDFKKETGHYNSISESILEIYKNMILFNDIKNLLYKNKKSLNLLDLKDIKTVARGSIHYQMKLQEINKQENEIMIMTHKEGENEVYNEKTGKIEKIESESILPYLWWSQDKEFCVEVRNFLNVKFCLKNLIEIAKINNNVNILLSIEDYIEIITMDLNNYICRNILEFDKFFGELELSVEEKIDLVVWSFTQNCIKTISKKEFIEKLIEMRVIKKIGNEEFVIKDKSGEIKRKISLKEFEKILKIDEEGNIVKYNENMEITRINGKIEDVLNNYPENAMPEIKEFLEYVKEKIYINGEEI